MTGSFQRRVKWWIRSAAYIAAEAAFADYFARNYPGPDTVIFRALAAAGTEDAR